MAAAQLVLVTAAEGRSLVGATNFASVLPLAARGKNLDVGGSATLSSLCYLDPLSVKLFLDVIVRHLPCLPVGVSMFLQMIVHLQI